MPRPLPSTRELWSELSSGRLTATQLTATVLQNIADDDGALGSFLEVHADAARERAQRVDDARNSGDVGSLPLAGLPIAIKDNLCMTEGHTTCASRMLKSFRSPYDATCVARLKAAGAVLVGKTNLDEFAMGSSCENSAFQRTRNPYDPQRVPGGSSGGSAAAVGAGLVPAALGSDTGGSIRQPAAFSGLVGLKPTYGRVSRYGLVAFASSLDQVGPMTNDVFGAALLLDVMSGHDPLDSTSLQLPATHTVAELDQPVADLRIGVVREHMGAGIDPAVRAAVEQALDVYRGLGATIVDVELPHSQHAVAVYYLIAPSEASSNLARYDGVHYGHRAEQYSNLTDMYCRSRGEGFGPEVKRRIMLGTYALSSGYYDAYYNKALKVRRLISEDYTAVFRQVDVLLGPVTPTPAFAFDAHGADPLALYLADIFTIGANLAGLPAISVPCAMTVDGLPVGLQLSAAPLEEARLLRAARMYEQAVVWQDVTAAV